jgi:hypothetical protein
MSFNLYTINYILVIIYLCRRLCYAYQQCIGSNNFRIIIQKENNNKINYYNDIITILNKLKINYSTW